MIAYFKCTCTSKEKLEAQRLRREGYEIRITKYSQEYAKEAQSYGLKLPIVIENGTARSLHE